MYTSRSLNSWVWRYQAVPELVLPYGALRSPPGVKLARGHILHLVNDLGNGQGYSVQIKACRFAGSRPSRTAKSPAAVVTLRKHRSSALDSRLRGNDVGPPS